MSNSNYFIYLSIESKKAFFSVCSELEFFSDPTKHFELAEIAAIMEGFPDVLRPLSNCRMKAL